MVVFGDKFEVAIDVLFIMEDGDNDGDAALDEDSRLETDKMASVEDSISVEIEETEVEDSKLESKTGSAVWVSQVAEDEVLIEDDVKIGVEDVNGEAMSKVSVEKGNRVEDGVVS